MDQGQNAAFYTFLLAYMLPYLLLNVTRDPCRNYNTSPCIPGMRVYRVKYLLGTSKSKTCTSDTLFFLHIFPVPCVFTLLSGNSAEMDNIQMQIASDFL